MKRLNTVHVGQIVAVPHAFTRTNATRQDTLYAYGIVEEIYTARGGQAVAVVYEYAGKKYTGKFLVKNCKFCESAPALLKTAEYFDTLPLPAKSRWGF